MADIRYSGWNDKNQLPINTTDKLIDKNGTIYTCHLKKISGNLVEGEITYFHLISDNLLRDLSCSLGRNMRILGSN